MVARKRSADDRVHVHEARDAAHDETNLGEARIDRLTGAHVFSYVVGTAFSEKDVTATMRTERNGQKKIQYDCHEYGLEMKAGDFKWSLEAVAFKDNCGVEHRRSCELDEATAMAFMEKMNGGFMKEQI